MYYLPRTTRLHGDREDINLKDIYDTEHLTMDTISSCTVLGIDPGITTTGWSIGKYNLKTNLLKIVAMGTIQATAKAKKDHKEDYKKYSNIISLVMYEEEMRRLMTTYMPDYIVSEDAFYNPKMPSAYLSLKLCIHTLQKLLYKEYSKLLYLIPPKSAKQCIYGHGTANKEAIQEAVFTHEDIRFSCIKKQQLAKMVEHEADSIAINYTFCKTILPTLLIS